MENNKTLISIGLPVYNAERYLPQTIDSLLAQDYPNFEVVITDNASTDRTADICRNYAGRNPQIRYYRHERNMGMYLNFNKAFELCRGDFFIWAGGHDYWDKNLLSSCVEEMLRFPDIVLCTPQYKHIDENGETISVTRTALDTRGRKASERFRAMLREPIFCFAVYSLMRANALRKTHLFSEAFFSDRILWAELGLNGEFYFTDKAYIYMRMFSARDSHEGRNEVDKVKRLIPPERVKSRSGIIMARFPFCQLNYRVLRALYASKIGLFDKLRLTFALPRAWIINALNEQTIRWIPRKIRKHLKRLAMRGREKRS